MQSLPVFEIIQSAFRFLWVERKDFLNYAALPIVVLGLWHTLVSALQPGANSEAQSALDGLRPALISFAVIGGVILENAAKIMFAVAWHRRWLDPAKDQTVWGVLKWDSSKTVFLFRTILISILSFFAALPFMFLGSMSMLIGEPIVVGIVFILVWFVASYVFARFSPMLPAAAISEAIGIEESWKLTKGNGARLVVVLAVPTLLLLIIVLTSFGLLGGVAMPDFLAGTMTGNLIFGLIVEFVTFAGIAMGVTALSMAYRRLRPTAPTNGQSGRASQ